MFAHSATCISHMVVKCNNNHNWLEASCIHLPEDICCSILISMRLSVPRVCEHGLLSTGKQLIVHLPAAAGDHAYIYCTLELQMYLSSSSCSQCKKGQAQPVSTKPPQSHDVAAGNVRIAETEVSRKARQSGAVSPHYLVQATCRMCDLRCTSHPATYTRSSPQCGIESTTLRSWHLTSDSLHP